MDLGNQEKTVGTYFYGLYVKIILNLKADRQWLLLKQWYIKYCKQRYFHAAKFSRIKY